MKTYILLCIREFSARLVSEVTVKVLGATTKPAARQVGAIIQVIMAHAAPIEVGKTAEWFLFEN